MNRENVLRLADAIETSDDFTMNVYWHMWPLGDSDCGTPACLAGHAAALYHRDHGGYVDSRPCATTHLGVHHFSTERTAAVFLGIDGNRELQGELFRPERDDARHFAAADAPDGITGSRAAAVLRHFAATGEVDWAVGRDAR